MAVDIDAFRADLEQLKNQRSIIQAKLDEANRKASELLEMLKGLGFSSVDDAKQAYVRQCADAENQHALVRQLIEEIKKVDQDLPTREDVMARLASLDLGQVSTESESTIAVADPTGTGLVANLDGPSLIAEEPVVPQVPHDAVGELPASAFVSPQTSEQLTTSDEPTINNGEPDLGQMLFASL